MKIINTSISADINEKEAIIQSNHSTVDILYSEHLVIADRFPRNQPTPGQTFIGKPLYSGNFYSQHSLKWTVFSANT